ncbi:MULTISPECIES: hypothetical protein [unclassified Pseudoclavibacter]|uniref:hypothetical protein n=1 Tax=unclassified Pseudoclavibacter TaxID=2615177 RepID=UPI000CE8FB71|nr:MULTISPECIES: hypothetical protein [unclassified Pseudoclavibacter]MBS3177132.1 hypothetical protein [Pseudoclavibacter sp. Marseille-Q4354]NYF12926.1 Na+/proline symporter [Pseudoclavibacter sp. JAI123]PPG28031.1 hypothetical protein C5B97_14240 [Pseudoclavibacter sp. RFBB5]
MVDLISYAALALPVVVFILLSLTSKLWPRATAAGAWTALGAGIIVSAYGIVSMAIPSLDPTDPDFFLGSFLFAASLIAGGVGTMLIVGVFGAAARFRTIRARRLAQPEIANARSLA